MSARALCLCALLAGCSGPSNAVDLTIVADGTVDDDRLSRIAQLTIFVSGTYTGQMPYAVSGLHKEERVELIPTVSSGVLLISVVAADANGVRLADGMAETNLTGGIVPAMVTLSASAPPSVTITPAAARVTRGKTQQFSANVPVIWSVTGAGSIDDNGLYTAPDAPGGPYSVYATAQNDPTAAQTARVDVVDYGLELYALALGGFGEADGVGGAARFSNPVSIVSDGNGIFYIGTQIGCTLRRLDPATAAVTTIGGVANDCKDVDGKLGSTARFSPLMALAYDATNHLIYAGEALAVRRVDLTTGDVTTLQTGTGPVMPSTLRGLAYDAGNNVLYTAERGSHSLERVTLTATSTVTVLAGTVNSPGSADAPSGPGTAASFNSPNGLAFDGTNLFVADQNNHTIRKVVVATGAVTTIAGVAGMSGDTDGVGGAARLFQPYGLAINGAHTTLYIAEQGGKVVRTLALANNDVHRIAGVPYVPPDASMPATFTPALDSMAGPSAVFGSLNGIAFDQGGAGLFVIDKENQVVRNIVSNGNFATSTVAGTAAPYGYVDGPATTARAWQLGAITTDGNVFYFSDNTNAVVRKFDPATGEVSTVAGKAGFYGAADGPLTMARFSRPEGIFVDGNNLFVSDGNASTIRQIDLSSGMVSTLAGLNGSQGNTDGTGKGARFGYPLYLTGDHQDHLYVSDGYIPGIRRVTISTGDVKLVAGDTSNALIMDGQGLGARFRAPYGLAIENGVLYVCDATAIRSVSLDGMYNVVTVAGSATTGLDNGMGGAATFTAMGACAGDGHGHLYTGDSGLLRRFDIASGAVSTVLGTAHRLIEGPGPLSSATTNGFSGGAFTPAGDLVFTDGGESAIMLVRLP